MGKQKYDQQLLNKLEKRLGVYLSGNNIGKMRTFGKK